MRKNDPIRGSKHQAARLNRSRRQQRQRVINAFIFGGVVLLVATLLIYPTVQRSFANVGEIVQVTPDPRPMADFNAMGDPNAPVKMEEFSDFQCPYCKRFSDQTQKLIVEQYVATGKVYFVYIPYGPSGRFLGPESPDASMAAFCAGDQGMFWEYHDIIFANHTGENVGDYTEKRLEAFAEMLGLNMDEFRACTRGNQHEQLLQAGIDQGLAAGVGGTPSFLINGKLIEGAQPYSVFQQEIEAALQAANSN